MNNPGQFLIVGIPGEELKGDTLKILEDVKPTGIILFSRNIKAPEQLKYLVESIYDTLDHPLITIDQEGGRVARLREIGHEPPNAEQLREHGNLDLIKKHGELTGKLLATMGININLCPVLDISFKGDLTNSLRGRTWGLTPNEVIQNASLFNKAMREEGVLSCAKHFPGYSCAEIDPHHDLPIINKTIEDLDRHEWIPYLKMLQELDSIMVGHAYYPNIEKSDFPTSLSEYFLKEILRNRWGYKGISMSDDLDMGAITNRFGFGEASRLAVDAGNDLLLLCHRLHLVPEAANEIAKLEVKKLAAQFERVENLKAKFKSRINIDLKKFTEVDLQIRQLREDVLGPGTGEEKSPENANRSPVEEY